MPYDDTDLSDLNRARAALGDTSTTELLTDDHIELVIATDGYNAGVASLANELAARFARKPSAAQIPGGLGATWGERIAEWRRIAGAYTTLAATDSAAASTPLSSRARTVVVW